MRTARRLLLLLVVSFGLTGCTPAQWAKAIPVIQKAFEYAQDASTILDIIDVQIQPRIRNDPKLEGAYVEKMTVARKSLDVAVRLTSGAEHLTKGEVHEAFADFRAAYLDLTALLQSHGLMTQEGFLRAGANATDPPIEVPQPLVFEEP